jgi:hypothetical protein
VSERAVSLAANDKDRPEAFVPLPDATLKSTGFAEVGVLNLECVTLRLPIPEVKSAEERTVYLLSMGTSLKFES